MIMLPEFPKPSKLHYVFFSITAIALLCLTIGLGIQYKRIDALEETLFAEQDHSQLDVLQLHQIDLSEQLEILSQDLQVAQSKASKEFELFTIAVEKRLAQLQSNLQNTPPDLSAVFERIDQLQKEVNQLSKNQQTLAATKSISPKHPPAAVKPPILPAPAFMLLGLELRGNERLVSVMPKTAAALSKARLIRIGEEVDGWVLKSVDKEIAIFQKQNQIHKISLPQRTPE